jgi:para-nitrobenzyl esterase
VTIVQLTSGTARGHVHDGVAVHLGIPYATASRFRAPEAAAPGHGELDATAFGPIAPQAGGAQFQRADLLQDEQCLSLNVWAPTAPADRPRPVMLWIHGGAFVHGSSASPLYDGAALARRGDVVVVSINYRLGALGFLSHPDLEGDDGTNGNWGLLDQIEALRWVQANAAAFGGDPGNVTIFGESAGAVSVLLLCASPRTDGLIHRAVAQSGAALCIAPEKAAEHAERLTAALGLDRVGDLRTAPVDRILHAQARTALGGAAGMRTFVPTIDGVVLDRPPLAALADGAAAGVPLVVGTNVDEWKLFAPADPHSRDLDEDGLRGRLERRRVRDVDHVLTTFRSARATRGEATEARDVWFAFESERFFRVPALAAAEAHATRERSTFVYLFGWGSPAMRGWLGACHGLEIAYVFGTQGRDEVARFTGGGPEADALAHTMMDAWVAFARSGDPSTPAHPWPAYDTVTRPTMCFDVATRLERAPREPERAVVAASVKYA